MEVPGQCQVHVVRVGSGGQSEEQQDGSPKGTGAQERDPIPPRVLFSNKWLIKPVRYRNPTSSENI